MGRAGLGSIGLMWLLAASSLALEDKPGADPAQAEFFEAKVRPILAGRCFECHGEAKQKGGLRLDSPGAMRSGGDTGPVIVGMDPEQSLLIEAVRHDGAVKMPPKGKLDAAEIDVLTDWVKRGAPWPGSSAEVRPEAASRAMTISEADRSFWAFQPVKDAPPPSVKRTEWPRTSIDPFILAKLEENGLSPSPPADRRTLLRRATFDLIGLPPAPEEIEAFLKDESTDAFAKVVDRLLASPHYGERWGRHWLDVARYGEDQAHSFQPRLYPNGFRYRDWVAGAFNSDMPYDRFVVEQIAGDLMDGPGRIERLAAPGFFALGPVYYGDAKMYDQVDDRIDTMTRGFLGLTVSCARCHDHKFDPIPTADYYALAGVFQGSEYQEAAAAPPEQVERYDRAQAEISAKSRDIDSLLQFESTRLHAFEDVRNLAAGLAVRASKAKETRPSAQEIAKREGLDADRIARWVALLDRSKDHPRIGELLKAVSLAGEPSGPDDEEWKRIAMQAAEGFRRELESLLARRDSGGKVEDAEQAFLGRLFEDKGPLAVRKDRIEKELPAGPRARLAEFRAQKDRLQKACPPKYAVVHTLKDREKPVDSPVLIRGNPATPGPKVSRHFLTILGGDSAPFTVGSGRLELARSIASPANPLTPRVMVNRLWQHHFGRGIVATTSNFGKLGERPSHPELLDHLASRFVQNGWSVKALHREIMLSSTYQQTSKSEARSLEVDPENRLLGRMSRKRLEVEAWRDSLLAVSGRLDPTVGGPSRALDDRENRRRTFYAAVSRHDLAPMLRLFDFPDPNITGAERTRTTVPLQALVVLNDEFLVESSKALAARALSSAEDDGARIRWAYAALFGRPATDREEQIGREYLSSPEPEGSPASDLSRWDRYAQALLGTNEFVFID